MRPRPGCSPGKGDAVVGKVDALGTKLANLQSTAAQLKQGASKSVLKAARAALSMLLLKELILALVTAAILLCLFGLYLQLATVIAPAAAAFSLGIGTLLSVVAVGFFGIRLVRRRLQASFNTGPSL